MDPIAIVFHENHLQDPRGLMHRLKFLLRYLVLSVLLLLLSVSPTREAQSAPLMTVFLPLIAQGSEFRSLGPEGGHIVSLAIDPGDSDVIYAGTWGSGMYKSFDNGATWMLINDGLDNLFINTVAIDPVRPATIYLGTQTDGVYKSLNGGLSWAAARSGLNQDAIVYSLAIDPLETNILYAGTRSPGGVPPYGGGVYKSVDGGASWMESNAGLGEDWVYEVAVHPTHPNVLYAATHSMGVYKSLDSGANWNAYNNGLGDLATRELIIDPQTPKTLYVGTWHGGAVYKSTDGAVTWESMSSGLNGAKVFAMAIDPNATQNLYVASYFKGVYRTTNGGMSWNSAGLSPDFIYAVAVDPDSSTTIYASTAGDGIYKSSDQATTWDRSNAGLIATSITSMLVAPGSPSMLYASIFGGGVYVSADKGESWQEANSGLADKGVNALAMDPANPLILYAATNSSGIYKSIDGGNSWNSSNSGLPSFSGFSEGFLLHYDTRIPVDIIDEGVIEQFRSPQNRFPAFSFGGTTQSILSIAVDSASLYIGTRTDGVFKSLDGGTSWNATGLGGVGVFALAIDPYNQAVLFAGLTGEQGSVLMSLNGGDSWVIRNSGLNNSSVYGIDFDPNTENQLYAATKIGLYSSSDAGAQWNETGLSGLRVYAVSVHPSNSNVLYAGTDAGLYVTDDKGATWILRDSGMVNTFVQSLSVDSVEDLIYIGSKGSGGYRRGNLIP